MLARSFRKYNRTGLLRLVTGVSVKRRSRTGVVDKGGDGDDLRHGLGSGMERASDHG